MRFAKYRGTYGRTYATAAMQATTTKTLALGANDEPELLKLIEMSWTWLAAVSAAGNSLPPPAPSERWSPAGSPRAPG
ncbi:hypothetical protein ACF08N_33850 [Streptomyces sp. NPDC015127]|uniref:hypothetical protein n=1 Tax=Streptomyces sp. NPDC015127 TaxID=3364939 RepID=UPI0036FB757B